MVSFRTIAGERTQKPLGKETGELAEVDQASETDGTSKEATPLKKDYFGETMMDVESARASEPGVSTRATGRGRSAAGEHRDAAWQRDSGAEVIPGRPGDATTVPRPAADDVVAEPKVLTHDHGPRRPGLRSGFGNEKSLALWKIGAQLQVADDKLRSMLERCEAFARELSENLRRNRVTNVNPMLPRQINEMICSPVTIAHGFQGDSTALTFSEWGITLELNGQQETHLLTSSSSSDLVFPSKGSERVVCTQSVADSLFNIVQECIRTTLPAEFAVEALQVPRGSFFVRDKEFDDVSFVVQPVVNVLDQLPVRLPMLDINLLQGVPAQLCKDSAVYDGLHQVIALLDLFVQTMVMEPQLEYGWNPRFLAVVVALKVARRTGRANWNREVEAVDENDAKLPAASCQWLLSQCFQSLLQSLQEGDLRVSGSPENVLSGVPPAALQAAATAVSKPASATLDDLMGHLSGNNYFAVGAAPVARFSHPPWRDLIVTRAAQMPIECTSVGRA